MWLKALAGLIVLLPLYSFANTVQTITVSGAGSSTSVPDQFTFTAVVEERGASVTKLQTTVSSKVTQIVQQLLASGIEEKYIQSMQISLSPWYERTPEGSRQNGFVLSRRVNVSVHDLEQYAAVLDNVLRAGAARIEGFQFVVSDPERDYQLALQRAVENARARAQVIAAQAQVELGEVLSISQHAGYQQPQVFRQAMMAQESQADLPGQVVTSTNLQVVFAIH